MVSTIHRMSKIKLITFQTHHIAWSSQDTGLQNLLKTKRCSPGSICTVLRAMELQERRDFNLRFTKPRWDQLLLVILHIIEEELHHSTLSTLLLTQHTLWLCQHPTKPEEQWTSWITPERSKTGHLENVNTRPEKQLISMETPIWDYLKVEIISLIKKVTH